MELLCHIGAVPVSLNLPAWLAKTAGCRNTTKNYHGGKQPRRPQAQQWQKCFPTIRTDAMNKKRVTVPPSPRPCR